MADFDDYLDGGPVKLQFLSEAAKQRVIAISENPFQKAFVVDVEANGLFWSNSCYHVGNTSKIIPLRRLPRRKLFA